MEQSTFIKSYIFLFMIFMFLPIINCETKTRKTNKEKKQFISSLTIPEKTIQSNQLSEEWIEEVQTSPANNYKLENGELLLGNEIYSAISYSGYRKSTRGDSLPNKDEYCPTVDEIKEDIRILSAMGIKLLRTYDTQLYQHAPRVLEAIHELKQSDPDFEMYVMLGAWIQCKGAYTDKVDHSQEDYATNKAEMDKAIELAAKYPEIVKIIAVGNEAMVHWQAHWVPSEIILKWVRYAKDAKNNPVNGYKLPQNLLLTSSDNFATWGAQEEYRSDTLLQLIQEIDFISLHTYPFHDTYYNPDFWKLYEQNLSKREIIIQKMESSFKYAVNQYQRVKNYLIDNDLKKPIHIGETGWATVDDTLYHGQGSGATDEVKMKLYYKVMKKWCHKNNISCFYFEAFNEPWKGGKTGSESHFGLFTVDGKAKYALWHLVDKGTFQGLKRGGNQISKTYDGDFTKLYHDILIPDLSK